MPASPPVAAAAAPAPESCTKRRRSMRVIGVLSFWRKSRYSSRNGRHQCRRTQAAPDGREDAMAHRLTAASPGIGELRLDRLVAALPTGFETMRSEALAEGYRFIERLATDWGSGALRFTRPGEVLLAAYSEGVLAGIGGLTLDPAIPEALRMRRQQH